MSHRTCEICAVPVYGKRLVCGTVCEKARRNRREREERAKARAAAPPPPPPESCPYCGVTMPPMPYRGPKRKTCGRAYCRDRRKARLEAAKSDWALDAVLELRQLRLVRAEELSALRMMLSA